MSRRGRTGKQTNKHGQLTMFGCCVWIGNGCDDYWMCCLSLISMFCLTLSAIYEVTTKHQRSDYRIFLRRKDVDVIGDFSEIQLRPNNQSNVRYLSLKNRVPRYSFVENASQRSRKDQLIPPSSCSHHINCCITTHLIVMSKN